MANISIHTEVYAYLYADRLLKYIAYNTLYPIVVKQRSRHRSTMSHNYLFINNSLLYFSERSAEKIDIDRQYGILWYLFI